MTTRTLLRAVVFVLLALFLAGCHRNPTKRQYWVVIADCSASIKPSSRKIMIQEISDLARTLHRGDTLTIIPVMSDELTQVQGHILRFHVPKHRQPFDADKLAVEAQVHSALMALEHELLTHPGLKSDILGAEAVAEQVLAHDAGSGTSEHLLILSDLVEDDTRINFVRAPEMRSQTAAKRYAKERAAGAGPAAIHGVPAQIDLLGSTDLAGLGQGRRVQILRFWRQFMENRGFKAGQPHAFPSTRLTVVPLYCTLHATLLEWTRTGTTLAGSPQFRRR